MNIEKNDIVKIICSGNMETIQQFEEHFTDDLDVFAETFCRAFKQFQEMNSKINMDERTATISYYLFNGMRNLICSFQLLFLGYLIPSGNMMRQFMESIDVAILFKVSESEFEKFQRKGAYYRVGYAADKVSKHLNSTKIYPAAWKLWLEQEKHYNLTSHPSAFALSEILDFNTGNKVLGSHLDIEKMEGYRNEITNIISAAQNLENLIAGILE